MRARIYIPAKSAMQSGRGKTGEWLVEPEAVSTRAPEPLMGWTSAGDPLTELRGKLTFKTLDEAVAFATKQGWEYSVTEPKARVVEPRNYLDNFKGTRPADATVPKIRAAQRSKLSADSGNPDERR
jgi:hypothetical protein